MYNKKIINIMLTIMTVLSSLFQPVYAEEPAGEDEIIEGAETIETKETAESAPVVEEIQADDTAEIAESEEAGAEDDVIVDPAVNIAETVYDQAPAQSQQEPVVFEYVKVGLESDFAAELLLEKTDNVILHENQELIEAVIVKESGNDGYMIPELINMPQIRNGEYLSIYGLNTDGTLFDYPVAEHIATNDSVHLPLSWYKGFALIKEGQAVPGEMTIAPLVYPDNKINSVEISGVMPEGAEVTLDSAAGLDNTTLFSYDIKILSEGTIYQPEAGKPVTVTIDSPLIAEAINNGYDIGVTHIHDNGAMEEISVQSVEGSSISFLADSFSKYDVYKVGSLVFETTDFEETVSGYNSKIEVSAPEGMTDVRWQVLLSDGATWVNIAGETGNTIFVTYPMVAMVNDGNTAIRACGTINGEETISDPQTIHFEQETTSSPVRKTGYAMVKKYRSTAKKLNSSGDGVISYGDLDLAGDADTYNIVVNFVFNDGSIAQEPLITTVNAGESFNETIQIQSLIGYEPYMDGDTAPRTEFTIDLTNINENHIYTVIYRPTLVEYRVEHYWQDIYNNTYTLHDTDIMEGYTGDTAERADKNYSGFYALLYETPTIAADGSTVVAIYYDRFYYLIDYDLQGGTGVDPIYARYDTPLTQGDPTKEGYTFAGWQPDVPETIPVGGGTYTAQWTPEETTYTVLYWYENATNAETYTVMDSAVKTAMSGSEVSDYTWRNQNFEGRDDTHFSYDQTKSETYTVNGDGTTTVNVYFKRQQITFRFVYDNGTTYTMTGKWGGSFAEFGYEWPSDAFWRYQNNSGGYTGMTFMDAFIPTNTMPDPTYVTFTETSRDGHVLAFYRQQTDGSYKTGEANGDIGQPDTQVKSNGTFTITNKYEGFAVKDYRHSSNSSRTAWIDAEGNEYTGSQFYKQTNSDTGTQYGIVDGNVVQLTHGAWIKDDGTMYTGDYKYAVSTATSNVYGVVDGNVYPTSYGYYYTNGSGQDIEYEGSYFYTETTSNTGTTYGLVDGEMFQLYRSNGYEYNVDYFTNSSKSAYYWNGNGFTNATIYYHDGKYYRTRTWSWFDYVYSNEVVPYSRTRVSGSYRYYFDGELYTGTRYTRSTSSTSTYAYGLVNGEIVRLTRGMLCNGRRYQGTRYARSSALSFDSGTFYGFEHGEMIPIYADTTHWLYHGENYEGQRYTMTTNPSAQETYFGWINGEMVAITNQTITDGWTDWQPATANYTTIPNDNYTYQIRFERQRYDLKFYNHNSYLTNKEEHLPYQASIAPYEFTPEYPDDLPYGKYYFAGWYDNQELQGQPFDFNVQMPANHLTLFAKWSPVLFDVEVYRNIEDLQASRNPVHTGQYPYDSLVPTPAAPTDPKYTFVGWFYQNDYGDELPYQFSTTTVKKNVKIYGKWTSEVLVTYTIHYTDEEGNPVADSFTSSAIEGSSQTFKATDELYDEYSQGYFPIVSSHSIMFDSDKDNDYTFIYRHMQAVPYTVHYVDDRTGERLADDKVVAFNQNISVTEKFLPITGYIPDRFQKTLIVQLGDPSKNEITFRYKKDSDHAYYLESHYIEKPDGTWRLYNALDVLADIGAEVTINPLQIDGYTLNTNLPQTVQSGTVSEEGLELKLYYELNTYPYKVRYLDYRTNAVLAPEKLAEGKFGSKVTENAVEVDRYELISDSPATITITRDDADPIRNVITFYYQLAQAEYNYVPVGGGSVTNSREIIAALTGTPDGSEPVYDPLELTFLGWFLDEAGTQPVNAGLIGENDHLTPVKQEVSGKMRYVSATYYALFAPAGIPVRIIKTDSDDHNIGLPGAVFSLKINGEAPTVIIDSQTVVLSEDLISDSNGVVFDGKLRISEDAYSLREVTPPDQYDGISGEIPITVSATGISVPEDELIDLFYDAGNDVWIVRIGNKHKTPAPTNYSSDNTPYGWMLLVGIAFALVVFIKCKGRATLE